MVHSLLLPHGGEVLWIDEDPEEVVKWIGLDKQLQSSGVEAQGTQSVG